MGEFIAVVLSIIQAVMPIIEAVGAVIEIKQGIDTIGNTVTEIVQMIDTDGDGTFDSQNTLFTIDVPIPDLSGGMCLCNNDDGDLGLGFPMFQLIDGSDIASYIDVSDAPFNLPVLTGTNGGYLFDMDFDGAVDDVLVPLGHDLTGDSIYDFGWILDLDDNNLPDAAIDLPFYPVGSEEFNKYAGEVLDDVELGIMDKSIDDYTVTEGLLLLLLLINAAFFFRSIFKRKDMYR